jgi:hypothetical protein
LKAIFAAAKDTIEYDRIESKALFNKLKDTVVPNLAKVKKFDDKTGLTDLEAAFTALKEFKKATDVNSDEKKI